VKPSWPSLPVLLAGILLQVACGSTGSSTPSSVGSPSSTSTPVTTTASTTGTTPTPGGTQATGTATVDIPALHLHATLVAHPCTDFTTGGLPLPNASSAYFMDCTTPGACPATDPCGFYGVIVSVGGALQPLAALSTAPTGTVVRLIGVSAVEIDRTLNTDVGTLSKGPSGWGGHGVPPGKPLFVEIRGASSETERTGTA